MLGLVLMACVARVCRITGITDVYEQMGSVDMHMVMGMMDDGMVEEELGSLLVGGGEGEDEGVVVQREEE
jgi:ribonuclease MRP protein subunit RMP1